MERQDATGQTKGEEEADNPAIAKQKTVAMISRRKCSRRGEDTTMDDCNEGRGRRWQRYDTDDVESLEEVAAVSLLSDADASGDKVVIYDKGDGGKLATTKTAVAMKAEQQSATKRGWWQATHCNMASKCYYCTTPSWPR